MIRHRTPHARALARACAIGAAALLSIVGVGVTPALAATDAAATAATTATTAAASPAATATTPIAVKPVAPEVAVDAAGATLGAITAVAQDDAQVTLTAERGAMRVTFLEGSTFRLEADPSGQFTDPANTPQGDPARTADIV